MAKNLILILLFVILLSCKKDEVVEEKIPFNISIKNFELKDRFVNNNEDFPHIENSFGGASVIYSNNTDTFLFDTKNASIENYLFELPAGIYNIEIESPPASLFGQSTPSFKSTAFDIEISDLTDTIPVSAEPTCALIVVIDDNNRLDKGAFIMESPSLENKDFKAYPLILDTISKAYYTYLLPDTFPEKPNAFLWFFSEETGETKDGLHTDVFEIGYKYLIKVLE